MQQTQANRRLLCVSARASANAELAGLPSLFNCGPCEPPDLVLEIPFNNK